MEIYDFAIKMAAGKEISMSDYKNKVILIVNTATRCGFTAQFEQLEELYRKYQEKSFIILGFPCNQFLNQEPLPNEEIVSFCKINFGVTFPIMEKVQVNGKQTAPIYDFLKSAQGGVGSKNIKWNFTKFLVDKQGNVVGRFAPTVQPLSLEDEILSLLEP